MRHIWCTLFFLPYILLLGCAHPIVIIPDEIGERGLLVGQIDARDLPDAEGTDPVIDDKTQQYGVRQGYMVVPLYPGEHELASLRSESSTGAGYSSITGNMYSVHVKKFPINKKFTIEAGKVTNIGLVVLRSASGPEPSKKLFNFLFLDNTRDMTRFMQDSHPRLYASLPAKSFLLAPGTYLNPDQVNRMRYDIALQTMRKRLWQHQHVGTRYVTGPLGTAAKLEWDAAGKLVALKILDTNTLVDLSYCSTAGLRVACMKSLSEYIMIEGDAVSLRSVPAGVVGNSVFLTKDGSVVMVDNAMNIYTSRNDGRTWTKYSGATRAKPLGDEFRRPDPKNRFGFHAGRLGYYIFSRDMDADETVMVYADYINGTYTRLNLPNSIENIRIVQETDLGLFINPAYTYVANSKVPFLPAGKNSWEMRELPQGGCFEIAFKDKTGKSIQVHCAYGRSVWKSDDGGNTWKPFPLPDSLFAS